MPGMCEKCGIPVDECSCVWPNIEEHVDEDSKICFASEKEHLEYLKNVLNDIIEHIDAKEFKVGNIDSFFYMSRKLAHGKFEQVDLNYEENKEISDFELSFMYKKTKIIYIAKRANKKASATLDEIMIELNCNTDEII